MIKRIKCLFGYHDYEVIQDFNDGTRRVGCPCCKKEWGMNDHTKTLIPWDYELQSMYRDTFGFKIKNPRWHKPQSMDDRLII